MPIRILIADDNAPVRTAMRQLLEGVQQHWEIIEAENGKQAVEMVQEFRPSLAILDLAMPAMDGLAAAREIGKWMPHMPILMHTMYWSPQIEFEARKIGVRKVVPKSESSVLVAAVEELLRSMPPEFPAKIAIGDKIRDLSAQLLATEDEKLHLLILEELQAALQQQIGELRARVVGSPVHPAKPKEVKTEGESPAINPHTAA